MGLSFFGSHIWQYYTYYQGPCSLEIQILKYCTYYMYYYGSRFFWKSYLTILHILHILPGVLGFWKFRICHITHITCITMGLSFLGSQICQYYTYYTYYQGSLFFINSNIAILHILHVLPWVSLFLEVIFDNITHITRGPWFLEIQNLQYYTYYMYYHGSLFFGKSNLAILHILHILPGVLGFYKLKYCNITHITCITMGLSFSEVKFGNITHITFHYNPPRALSPPHNKPLLQ